MSRLTERIRKTSTTITSCCACEAQDDSDDSLTRVAPDSPHPPHPRREEDPQRQCQRDLLGMIALGMCHRCGVVRRARLRACVRLTRSCATPTALLKKTCLYSTLSHTGTPQSARLARAGGGTVDCLIMVVVVVFMDAGDIEGVAGDDDGRPAPS
ncbi:hypothetical protein BJV78DRAFT_1230126 [Lactifluus subvellereus]|nr:hypothetical protein BJV78DRAFT_1230126 [Lactifluus subvellereus]